MMNCIKNIGYYSFSKPRTRRVRKTASANVIKNIFLIRNNTGNYWKWKKMCKI